MKYTQTIGIIAALVVLLCSFLPWSIVVSEQITISGFDTKGTRFGKPGMFLNFFTIISTLTTNGYFLFFWGFLISVRFAYWFFRLRFVVAAEANQKNDFVLCW